MSTNIPQNSVAPAVYRLAISSANAVPVLDLTTMSDAVINVKKPDGTTTTWAATILSGATATSATLSHTFGGTDTALLGQYLIYATLTVAGGTVITSSSAAQVVDPFANPG